MNHKLFVHDVDVFAKFEPGALRGVGLDYFGYAPELSEILGGKVDLCTKLNKYIRASVEKECAKGEEVIEIQDTFDPGNEVEVAEGTFAGIRALVKAYYSVKERVRLLLEFLGRQTEVALPSQSIVKGDRIPRVG